LLASAIETGTVPRFEESGIRHGRLHLSCEDSISFNWLQASIASITIPGDGDTHLQLELMLLSQLPRWLRAEVYVSGSPPGDPRFLSFVRAQNTGLHTKWWILCHRQSTSRGQLMVWHIDQESADVLAAVNDQPYLLQVGPYYLPGIMYTDPGWGRCLILFNMSAGRVCSVQSFTAAPADMYSVGQLPSGLPMQYSHNDNGDDISDHHTCGTSHWTC